MQRKNPLSTSTEIHASFKESGMAVSACTIRRYLNKNEPHGKVARKKPLLIASPISQKNPLTIWQTAPREASKLVEQNHLKWWNQNQTYDCKYKYCLERNQRAYAEEHIIPTMKHGGGSLLFIFWGVSLCVRYSSMENLVKIDGKMNAEEQKIMGEKFAFISLENAHGTHLSFPIWQ